MLHDQLSLKRFDEGAMLVRLSYQTRRSQRQKKKKSKSKVGVKVDLQRRWQ